MQIHNYRDGFFSLSFWIAATAFRLNLRFHKLRLWPSAFLASHFERVFRDRRWRNLEGSRGPISPMTKGNPEIIDPIIFSFTRLDLLNRGDL
jgi:hypothetical protein